MNLIAPPVQVLGNPFNQAVSKVLKALSSGI